MRKFVKDPSAVLDYTWEWADFLAEGEAIESKAIIQSADVLTVDSQANDDNTVTAWLSGGEVGERVFVTCRIVTDQGRTDDRSIYVWVANQ